MLRKILRAVLWFVVGVLALGVVIIAAGLWQLRAAEHELPDGTDIRTVVAGRWDWAHHGSLCVDSTHSISFDQNGRVMRITQQNAWVDSTGRDRTTAVYDIVSITQSRIRGQIRGEERLTKEGTPVVWDLVLSSEDEYRWHRTDWPWWGFTNTIVRCAPQAPSSDGGNREVKPIAQQWSALALLLSRINGT